MFLLHYLKYNAQTPKTAEMIREILAQNVYLFYVNPKT
jgi:hypothetical protein